MMTKTEIELAKRNGTIDEIYGQYVSELIRERYSLNQELALHRQRDTKPQEFAEYSAFAEDCKAKAKRELGI